MNFTAGLVAAARAFRSRFHGRWIARVAVLAGSVAGCAAGCAGAATPHSPQTESPTVQVTAADVELLHRAEQLLTRDCMRAAGFEYWITPRRPVPEYKDFPYVVDDPAWATKHGYGTALRLELEQLDKSNPNARYARALSIARREAAGRAMIGARPVGLTATLPNGLRVQHSDQGCSSQAQRELYGDLPTWYRTIKISENLLGDRVGGVTQDPRFKTAVAHWSTCMRAKGHSYPDPGQTRLRFIDPGKAPARPIELALAVAEAHCAKNTPLAATARELDAEYENRQRERFHEPLTQQVRLQREALPRAQAIVARG